MKAVITICDKYSNSSYSGTFEYQKEDKDNGVISDLADFISDSGFHKFFFEVEGDSEDVWAEWITQACKVNNE
jgi:hypothetical protein